MAERLGTGLQNLLQRFDSAWHLQTPLQMSVGAIAFQMIRSIKRREKTSIEVASAVICF